MGFLDNYPKLSGVGAEVDAFLRRKHPGFFAADSVRPYLELKPRKVIHDGVWGTFDFTWRELAILDTPLVQRLRDIHQIGLAYQVYPSARHSRLEHTLGVLVMASRIFDALMAKHRSQVRDSVKVVFGTSTDEEVGLRIEQLKQELRIAAMLHDVGHSLHSHASERVFGKLQVLKEAAEELSDFAGKGKGAGEVVSFCVALAPCLREWMQRAEAKLHKDGTRGVYDGPVDMENIALLIVGRSKHPFLQFLGDIISSDIDADKLDYLLRDSTSAGLPLRYDVDMYLYSVQLDLDQMKDGEGALEKLYGHTGATGAERRPADGGSEYPYYEAYRLCLPKRAMHVLEQIVICKMMLFSYVYHHPKVRAAEGLLERMLGSLVELLKNSNKNEWEILEWFLEATDADLRLLSRDAAMGTIQETAYRIVNRLLPREIIRLSASEAVGPQKALLAAFLGKIRDKAKGPGFVKTWETAMGEELRKRPGFEGLSWENALAKAGIWVDVPKAPKFEDTQKVVSRSNSGRDMASGMFPVHAWQQGYTSYRWYVRVYAYSQFGVAAKECAKATMKRLSGIESDDFYKGVERVRF